MILSFHVLFVRLSLKSSKLTIVLGILQLLTYTGCHFLSPQYFSTTGGNKNCKMILVHTLHIHIYDIKIKQHLVTYWHDKFHRLSRASLYVIQASILPSLYWLNQKAWYSYSMSNVIQWYHVLTCVLVHMMESPQKNQVLLVYKWHHKLQRLLGVMSLQSLSCTSPMLSTCHRSFTMDLWEEEILALSSSCNLPSWRARLRAWSHTCDLSFSPIPILTLSTLLCHLYSSKTAFFLVNAYSKRDLPFGQLDTDRKPPIRGIGWT